MDWNSVLNFFYSVIATTLSWLWWGITLLITPGGWITIGVIVALFLWFKRRLPNRAREVVDAYSTAGIWRVSRNMRWSWGHWALQDYDWSKDTRGIAIKTITEKVEIPVRVRQHPWDWIVSTFFKMLLGAAILATILYWSYLGPYFWRLLER